MAYYYNLGRKFLLLMIVSMLFSFAPEKGKLEGVVFENEFIVITSRIEQCILPQNGTENFNVLMSIKNKTDKKIKVSFMHELYYDGECATCGKEEYRYNIEVDANEVKESTCEKFIFGLRAFHHMPNGMTKVRLTDMNLAQVTVSPVIE